MNIGIVGGGLMGLAIADHLATAGHRVQVFERGTQIGGLATWHDFGPFVWDRFYHVILPTDAPLLGFLKRLGLESSVHWGTTQTGYFVDSKFYPLSNNLDFLKFPPLNLWNKFRLAATILYCARIDDWQRLEKIPVEDFLRRTSGNATFEKFWKPLLLAKLGEQYKRVSAVFIWSYIKRMFSARDAAAAKEQLGYISGGYRRVFERVAQRVRSAGGEIVTGVEVKRVKPHSSGGVVIEHGGRSDHFDKVVFTGPVNVMRSTVDPDLVDIRSNGSDVEYLGVICGVLVTKKPLMPYYILNIGDEKIPFTGVIGMSNLVSTDESAGLHFSYLPKYLLSTDPLLGATDAELEGMFLSGIQHMFPEFSRDDIVKLHVNRAVKVQPLQVIDYSRLVQTPRTRNKDFYVVNTAQFVNNTLNNNQVIKTVDSFLAEFGSEFGMSGEPVVSPEGRVSMTTAGA